VPQGPVSHVIYSIHEREVLVRVVRISRRADVYG
jgi:hypothetical protein